MPSPAPTSNLTNPQDERFRDHVSDEAEDSQLQRLAPLSESQLRPDGVWKPMRPGSNVSSETGKRSFEYSPIGFPPTVAKSTNSTHRGRSRQRARLSGTTSQAPRHCRHRPELALGRTKSPKGSPERVLEAQRLISIGDAYWASTRFASVSGTQRQTPAQPTSRLLKNHSQSTA